VGGVPEDLARGEMARPELRDQGGGLGSLADSGWPEQNESPRPSWRRAGVRATGITSVKPGEMGQRAPRRRDVRSNVRTVS
jgi:hypothetical protein